MCVRVRRGTRAGVRVLLERDVWEKWDPFLWWVLVCWRAFRL